MKLSEMMKEKQLLSFEAVSAKNRQRNGKPSGND